MTGYRQLHTHIWSDSWFVELEPDWMLLFIYLFSNERASICGLYELPVRTICFETGLDREGVRQGLEAFAKANKVKYDFATSVVWVKNMLKYQGSTSPKVQARIQADIRAVPDCELKQQFLDTLSASADTLSIPYRKGSDTSIYSSSIDQFNLEQAQEQPGTDLAIPAEKGSPPPAAEPAAEQSQELPTTPVEAMQHPDVQVFAAVTGGRIPGLSQYQTVIEAVRLLRARQKLDDAALREYLAPYWIAWSGRKRLDGRPYDPGNITWLAEWALNGSIPSQSSGPARPVTGSATGPARPSVPTPEQTRRMLDERDEKIKHAVPMPAELRAKMRGLKEKLAVKDGR